MTQFTNIKYMGPELEQKTAVEANDTRLSSLASIPKTGIFNAQVDQTSVAQTMGQSKVADKSTLMNQASIQETKVNVAPTAKPTPKEIVKKEYLLPIIYKKLFNYFSHAFNADKPKKSSIESLNNDELREYADSLLIRNQELKSYLISLSNWQSKFTRSTPVPRSAPTANNNLKSNQTPGLNKPGLPARVGLGTQANTMNRPGTPMPNTARPSAPQNAQGMPNRPGMPNNARPSAPMQNMSGTPNSARPGSQMPNRPGMPNNVRPAATMPNTARPSAPQNTQGMPNRPGMPNNIRPGAPMQNKPVMVSAARQATPISNGSVAKPTPVTTTNNPAMNNVTKANTPVPNKVVTAPKSTTPIASEQSPNKSISIKAVIK